MASSRASGFAFTLTGSLLPVVVLTVACSSTGSAESGDAGPQSDAASAADVESADAQNADAAAGDSSSRDGAAVSCTAAIATVLQPIDKVSTGVVSILSESNGAKLVYVDASAGGLNRAASTPRLYLNLETMTRVDVTDVAAPTSLAWDLSLKRNVIFTNGGTAGPGVGGAGYVAQRSFESVTDADSRSVEVHAEEFVDADCNAYQDRIGGPLTSFGDWYEYDEATNAVRPKNGTFVVKSAAGKAYKIQIMNYYSTPDGGTGMLGGFFTLKVGPL